MTSRRSFFKILFGTLAAAPAALVVFKREAPIEIKRIPDPYPDYWPWPRKHIIHVRGGQEIILPFRDIGSVSAVYFPHAPERYPIIGEKLQRLGEFEFANLPRHRFQSDRVYYYYVDEQWPDAKLLLWPIPWGPMKLEIEEAFPVSGVQIARRAEHQIEREYSSDLNFLSGERWPSDTQLARPCLTINRLDGFIKERLEETKQLTPADVDEAYRRVNSMLDRWTADALDKFEKQDSLLRTINVIDPDGSRRVVAINA